MGSVYDVTPQRTGRTTTERHLIISIALLCVLLVASGVVLGVTNYKHPSKHSGVPKDYGLVCVTPTCVKTAENIMIIMNSTVDPCEDFYEYACGNWKVLHPIPDNKARFITFDKVRGEVAFKLKGLLEKPILNDEPISIKHSKVNYKSCMQTDVIEKLGVSPLLSMINREFHAWPLLKDDQYVNTLNLETILSNLTMLNQGAFFSRWVSPDREDVSKNIIQFDQPRLVLPSRDYYLEKRYRPLMQAYRVYAKRVVEKLGGNQQAVKDIGTVIDLEVQLAKILTPANERRDDSKLYKKMKISELQKMCNFIDWRSFLQLHFRMEHISISSDHEVVVYAVDYLTKLAALSLQKRTMINYGIWKFVVSTINFLPPSLFSDIKQDFIYALKGTSAKSEHYTTCIYYTTSGYGLAVGRMFVDKYFQREAKDNAIGMIKNIKTTFISMLDEATWMSKRTKANAEGKARAIIERIGYPDFILDDRLLDQEYSHLKPVDGQFFNNEMQIRRGWEINNIETLGKPVNKKKWTLAPSTVNAFYTPTRNQIAFPAGILQPPYYSKDFPSSINYGGIGVVIGHEITHGFDDQGRLYDANGNMKEWMDPADVVKYNQKSRCLVDQYSKYIVEQVNMNVDGKITLGENIADNGGVKESYRAYRQYISDQMVEENRLPGLNLTNNQLFFIGFAQVWCGQITNKKVIEQLKTDHHCPGKYRVIGTLSNSRDFAKAYKCKPKSRMNPDKKCDLW